MTSHWRWRVGADIVCFTYFHNFYIFVVNLYLYLKYSYIYIAIHGMEKIDVKIYSVDRIK